MKLSDYYKGYLKLHRHPKTRLLHFIGQWFTLFFAGFVFYNWYWYLIPFIPFVIYPFAWSGHYFFEKSWIFRFNFNSTFIRQLLQG